MKKKKNFSAKVETTAAPIVEQVAQPKIAPLASAKLATTDKGLPFNKSNYMIMIAGVALIIIGFFIMTMDKEPFGFGFMGLTLGPLVAFSGFMLEFYALLKN
jgi:hypothetical protein